MTKLHINLVCQDGTFITPYRPFDYLRGIGVSLLDIQSQHGKLTHTATLCISRKLNANELTQIADICNQKNVSQD